MTTALRTDLTVGVLLFARYAELLGAGRVELMLPAGATVRTAMEALRRRPGGASLPPRLLVARNLEQAGEDVVIRPGDELAVLPPLAGG